MEHILQSIPCSNVVVTKEAVVTCNDPTTNFASGCELLISYDYDGYGAISKEGETTASIHAREGIITNAEYEFVQEAFVLGRINKLCVGCYVATPVTCNDPTQHFANGCELLLHYDTDGDGAISLDEWIAAANDTTYVLNDAEMQFLSDAFNIRSINALCPGCYVEEQPSIVVSNITVTPSSCEEPCNISISIKWKNTGMVSVTFTPGYTINGTLYQDDPVTIGLGQTFTMTYAVYDLPSGNYVICPDPNP